MLRIACLSVLGGLLQFSPAIAADPAPFKFRGVEPGVTTEKQLLENDRWGEAKKREKTDDGAVWLEFEARGYPKLGVLLRGGKVQSIDITLPAGVAPATAASVLKLGEAAEGEELSFAALMGGPTDDGWKGARYSAGRVALFTDPEGKARLVRAYSAEVIASDESPPAAPVDAPAPDAPGKSAMKGQDATSRQIVSSLTKLLAQAHLSRHPVDDEIARRTLELFIKQLDPQKLYFTRADDAGFRRRYDMLDDQLQSGDMSMAYEIFELLLKRIRERVALVNELVELDHDFSVDEMISTNASQEEFPENELELREIWRKRVKYELLVQKAAGNNIEESRRLVRQKWSNYLSGLEQNNDSDLRATFLSALCSAYDPHSSYLAPEQVENFNIQNAAQLVGIGASLQVIDGYVTVSNIVPDSPTARDGRIKPGDRFLEIGQGDEGPMVNVVNSRLADTVKLIRGDEGATVRIRVLPKGEFESKVYALKRGTVQLNNIGQAVLSGKHLPAGRSAKVGFIRLASFYLDFAGQRAGQEDYRSCTRDVRRILSEFKQQNVDVVALDLRNNGGGALTAAVNMVGLFVPGEPLALQVKGHDGNVQSYSATGVQPAWGGPLVVLTNTASAGGSEIFAAAMRDYRRGLVIGDAQTHGMGTVANPLDIGQALFRVPNPPKLGYAKLSIQKYYGATGDSMQLRGVKPHLALPSIMDFMDIKEGDKPFALKFDRVAAAQYQRLTDYPLDDKLISRLIAASEARRSGSEFFQKLSADIAAYKAAKNQPISLNEEKFMARQQANSEEETPTVPGVPEAKFDGYLQEALAITLDYAGEMLFAAAERKSNQQDYAGAIPDYRGAVAAAPDLTRAHYKYAWTLATCPMAQLRNGRLAVTHANKACELDNWNGWHYILTLAIAEAEAGDFENAQKHIKTALEKAPADKRAPYQYLQQQFENRRPFRSR